MATKIMEINAATTAQTVTYFYDAFADKFVSTINSTLIADYGFRPTHKISIDAGLTAQEIDVIFERELFQTA